MNTLETLACKIHSFQMSIFQSQRAINMYEQFFFIVSAIVNCKITFDFIVVGNIPTAIE